MAEQEFKTPQEALAHYGKKGMKWGVTNEGKPAGGSGKGSKPPELSNADIKKAADLVNSETDPKALQAEGQKKLDAQVADEGFPTKEAGKEVKRGLKADKIEGRASQVADQISSMQRQRDSLGPGFVAGYKRMDLNAQINEAQGIQNGLLKKAEQVRAGKLTDNQKLLIGVGATAAIAGLAIYGNRQYTLHKADISHEAQKKAYEENLSKTSDQWKTLFGEEHGFAKSASSLTAGKGSFFGGLSNKKAFDRPEFTIPKDTVFQRLSSHQEDSSDYGKVKGTYATFLHNDKKLYGASGEFGSKAYTVSFQSKDDVRVPRISTVLAHLKQVNAQEYPGNPRMVTPERVYQDYHDMAGGNWHDSVSFKLFASLRQHGYSAIVDDMDAGYLGDLPVVFFGDAHPATSTLRFGMDQIRDSVGVLHTSGKYA